MKYIIFVALVLTAYPALGANCGANRAVEISGDLPTIAHVAKALEVLGVSSASIMEVNTGRDPRKLKLGDSICIPIPSEKIISSINLLREQNTRIAMTAGRLGMLLDKIDDNLRVKDLWIYFFAAGSAWTFLQLVSQGGKWLVNQLPKLPNHRRQRIKVDHLLK